MLLLSSDATLHDVSFMMPPPDAFSILISIKSAEADRDLGRRGEGNLALRTLMENSL